MARRKKTGGIKIVKDADGQLLLFINDQFVKAPAKQKMLLSYLYDRMGRVVPYAMLAQHLGYRSTSGNIHVMRQHVVSSRQLLIKHKAPCALVLSYEFGYGLCEIARE